MFVTGRYTTILLSVMSLLLWVVGAFVSCPAKCSYLNGLLMSSVGEYGCRVISLLLCVAVAFITGAFVILEERTPWLAGLFLFLCSILFPLQENVAVAASTLLLMVAVTFLLSCYPQEGIQRRIYTVFFIYSLAVLMVPQFIYLAPLFILYPIMTGVLGIKSILSLLLGVVTPFWLFYGFTWVFPSLSVARIPFEHGLQLISFAGGNGTSQPLLLFIVAELFIMLPAAFLFFTTSSPAKPLMRKMLAFFMLANMYMWLLQWVCRGDSSLLLAWRLPGFAIMAAYLFTVRITKLSNIYFVLIFITWLFVAALGIWNG